MWNAFISELQIIEISFILFCRVDADVHATTATGDTALTYACENGHTDVADVLLASGADLVSLYTPPIIYLLKLK